MKPVGHSRKVDELGRIVLPIELRRALDIAEKDILEIYQEGSTIVLRKYEPSCIFCGNDKSVSEYRNKMICATCLKALARL